MSQVLFPVRIVVRLCASMLLTLAAGGTGLMAAPAWQAEDTSSSGPVAQPEPVEQPDPFPLTDLPPLKRLVLYNSGVGQLQHGGPVDGNARLEIRFGGHDVDDVLKSLVFSDAGGGSARAVEYKPAPDPEDVAARMVGAPMTLAQLLQRFRGEEVTLTVAGSEVRGTIYGVENRSAGDEVLETVVLLNDQGLQSIALPGVDRVHFDKPSLREELSQAMAGLVKSRKANQKQLDLLLEGEGQREVEFAYVVDVPIWRMTYRLAMDQDEVYLQGWAHVDNVTGVDWEAVTMELRSGRPQAYHANVFAPLMAERPALGNSVYDFTRGLTLITQWFGYEPPARGMGGGGGFGGGPMSGAGPERAGIDIEAAFRNTASEGRAAQTVRYRIEKPVDLGAGRSAALPVFASRMPARLLTICDEMDQEMPPLHAVEFSNGTGLPIVSGPVSVMRQGDYVGDGKIGRLAVDEKTEIPYGIDRAVRFRRAESNRKTTLESMSVQQRLAVLQGSEVETRTYEIVNEDTEPRLVALYCPTGEGTNIAVTPEPDEQTDRLLRFVVPVDAQSGTTLEVVLTSPFREKKTVTSINRKELDQWLKDEVVISDEDQQFFRDLFAIDDRIAAVELEIEEQDSGRQSLLSEQSRMRENVESLTGNPEAAQSFVDKLLAMEQQMEDLGTRQSETRQRLDQLVELREQSIRTYQED